MNNIIEKLSEQAGGTLNPERLVDTCLDLMGPIQVEDRTREGLIEFADALGEVNLEESRSTERQKVADTLSMIASTREYQLA